MFSINKELIFSCLLIAPWMIVFIAKIIKNKKNVPLRITFAVLNSLLLFAITVILSVQFERWRLSKDYGVYTFHSSQEAVNKFPKLFLPPTEKTTLLKTHKKGYYAYLYCDEKVLKDWFSFVDKSRPRDGFLGGADFSKVQDKNHRRKRSVNQKSNVLKKHSITWQKVHDYQFYTRHMSAGLFNANIEVSYSPSTEQAYIHYNCGGIFSRWQPNPAPSRNSLYIIVIIIHLLVIIVLMIKQYKKEAKAKPSNC